MVLQATDTLSWSGSVACMLSSRSTLLHVQQTHTQAAPVPCRCKQAQPQSLRCVFGPSAGLHSEPLQHPVRSNKQKQRLTELEVEVAALSNADKGARGERAALLQRNATLQARHSALPTRGQVSST